jgi:hypothetical protein
MYYSAILFALPGAAPKPIRNNFADFPCFKAMRRCAGGSSSLIGEAGAHEYTGCAICAICWDPCMGRALLWEGEGPAATRRG